LRITLDGLGRFASTRRGGLDPSELAFVRERRSRNVGWAALSQMTGRSEADLKAALAPAPASAPDPEAADVRLALRTLRLIRGEPKTATMLARRMGEAESHVSALLKRLIREGHAERLRGSGAANPAFRLTARGQALLSSGAPPW
jgi:hypothetical protein